MNYALHTMTENIPMIEPNPLTKELAETLKELRTRIDKRMLPGLVMVKVDAVLDKYEDACKQPEQPVTDSVEMTQDDLLYWLDNPTKITEPEVSQLRQKLFDAIETVFYNSDYNKVFWRHKVNIAVDEILTIIEDT